MLIYQNNEFKCKEISKTQSGPGTDGKSKRPKSQQAKRKSFNNAFCSEFFSSKIVQQAFIIIIDAIFADRDISVLCYKFNIFCCDLHREQWKASRKNIIIRVIEALECQKKWADLKEFLTNKFISGMKSKPSKKKDFIDEDRKSVV